jgi:adenylate kinase
MVDWNIATLVGVPGVGKTSLSKNAARDLGLRHVNYGKLMLDVAMSDGLASNQGEMFKLEIEVQQNIWKDAALRVKEMSTISSKILLDLHGVDISKIGYIVSLPIEIISPDIIIVVESSFENVTLRRFTDKFRDRSLDGMKSMFEHRDMLRRAMLACSIIYGSNLTVLNNNDFETCLVELKDVLCG